MPNKDPKCALNLRGFPFDLKWKCREMAAKKKETLAQFVERTLREAVTEPVGQAEGKSKAERRTP
jgi:hypothetical protein